MTPLFKHLKIIIFCGKNPKNSKPNWQPRSKISKLLLMIKQLSIQCRPMHRRRHKISIVLQRRLNPSMKWQSKLLMPNNINVRRLNTRNPQS
ncbi:hypothetical protein FGO68_gene7394 [Halteria grandinella]|uniref:Uncharacterized protein n=1 Tax=Halteria grandinella TaxID=5974 RepID=A0A8J8SXW1_HALGN|nr:hypothetical protein FGO68_gene7394 [Halteria grandinella]